MESQRKIERIIQSIGRNHISLRCSSHVRRIHGGGKVISLGKSVGRGKIMKLKVMTNTLSKHSKQHQTSERQRGGRQPGRCNRGGFHLPLRSLHLQNRARLKISSQWNRPLEIDFTSHISFRSPRISIAFSPGWWISGVFLSLSPSVSLSAGKTILQFIIFVRPSCGRGFSYRSCRKKCGKASTQSRPGRIVHTHTRTYNTQVLF